jgi:hypothetical protein
MQHKLDLKNTSPLRGQNDETETDCETPLISW